MRQQSERDRAAGESLWRFSLALYARPGVTDALLALQDRAGRDVNVLLFGLWAGAARARRVDAAELAAAEAAIAPLNVGLVHQLRRLRHELKAADDADLKALRRRILSVEMAAERQAQRRLAAAAIDGGAHPQTTPLIAAEANLAVYLGNEANSAEAALLRKSLAALMRLA